MSPEARDYGEPFEVVCPDGPPWAWTVNRDKDVEYGGSASNWAIPNDIIQRRAAACMNALKGCPDPEGFLSAVRYIFAGQNAIRDALKRADGRTLEDIKQVLVTHDVDPRLDWIRRRP